MKKLTYDEVKKFIERLGFELITKEYLDKDNPLTIKDNEGFYYQYTYKKLKNRNVYYRYAQDNPYTIDNIRLWCKINNKYYELVDEVFINRFSPLKWKCLKEDCGDYFSARWSSIFNGKICTTCKSSLKHLYNNLQESHPCLVEEWHPTKNGDLTPHKVSYGTDKKVWWQCSKNPKHEWEAYIYNRSDGYGCPYCAGKLASEDYNLLLEYPELCKEWDYQKNDKKPEEYTSKSGAIVWWICSICENNWKSRIVGRSREDKGCSVCKLSKGEKIILKYLDLHNYEHEKQKEFDGLLGLGGNNLSFDFYIPNLNLLIEYQGEFHDGVARMQTQNEFEKQQEHDKRKKEYAQKHNIKLLEIWYQDFDKIEIILEKELNSYI